VHQEVRRGYIRQDIGGICQWLNFSVSPLDHAGFPQVGAAAKKTCGRGGRTGNGGRYNEKAGLFSATTGHNMAGKTCAAQYHGSRFGGGRSTAAHYKTSTLAVRAINVVPQDCAISLERDSSCRNLLILPFYATTHLPNGLISRAVFCCCCIGMVIRNFQLTGLFFYLSVQLL
jgi:hypothetical protein